MPNRPSDAELAKLLRTAAIYAHHFKAEDTMSRRIADHDEQRFTAAADALDAAPQPARLTHDEWDSAEDRATAGYLAWLPEDGIRMHSERHIREAVRYAMICAFPTLHPED